MAIVNIDLSEYDEIRKARATAEKQVEELKEEMKGLTNKSRVIIRTEFDKRSYDQMFEWLTFRRGWNGDAIMSNHEMLEFKRHLPISPSTEQYINFDDVRLSVTQKLETKAQEHIDDLKRSCTEQAEILKEKTEGLEKKFKKRLSDKDKEISDLEEAHIIADKEQKEWFKKSLDGCDETIQKLEKKITDLSKTQEENLREAQIKLDVAQAEVAKFTTPKKKGWFS